MIDALIAGKLYGQPTERTSKTGKPFAVAKVRAAAGDGESLFVNVIAFDRVPCAALLALADGDSVALAGSIKQIGLLQPIGIDAGYRLVFGERRLRAFKLLGRSTIPVRFVNLDSLLKGEHAENEFRKDFTVSERVEIGKALEGELAKRNGVRHDTSAAKENFPEVKGQTRDIAAKAAGFGNGKTYEQAKAVVATGAPELIEAVDKGDASVSAAEALLTLPKDEQATVVKKGKKATQQAAKKEREKKRASKAAVAPVQPAGTQHDEQNSLDDGEPLDF